MRWHLVMALCRGGRQPMGRKVFPRALAADENLRGHLSQQCSLDFSAGSTPLWGPEHFSWSSCRHSCVLSSTRLL